MRAGGTSSAATENMRGLALLLAGETAKALSVFEALLAADPAMVEARFNRAVALLKSGQNAGAAAEFESIALDSHNMLRASAAYHRALALDRLGRSEEALTWAGRSLALDNQFDSALFLEGALRERAGQVEAAARSYLTYLQRHPDSTTAMLRLGICAQRAGRVDVARTYLNRVLALAPQSAEASEARKFLVMWD